MNLGEMHEENAARVFADICSGVSGSCPGMRGANAEATTVSTPRGQPLDAFSIAGSHRMQWNVPGPSFFEGMFLGNGDVGVCAEMRSAYTLRRVTAGIFA